MLATSLLAFAGAASAAGIMGFNYGSTGPDGAAHTQQDFESQFSAAQKIAGGSFTSARLYTMIQGGSQADPISAIQAAVNTKTRLLLGIWASAGPENINNEITALQTAMKQYGSDFTDLVDGISVGSEDLYRVTPTSQKHDPGLVGAGPDEVADYINQVRQSLQGSPLSGAKIGHVDTWTAWANGSNAAVVDACDWLGMDAYPYFQDLMANDIANSKALFDSAWDATKAASKGKPVWITETGWPLSGDTAGAAEPNTQNAQQYWEAVGCGQLFGQTNTWWFTYYDGKPNPSFGLVSSVGGAPMFDLSCDKKATIGEGVASTLGGGVVGGQPTGGAYPTPTAAGGYPAGSYPTGTGSGSGYPNGSNPTAPGTGLPPAPTTPNGGGSGGDTSGEPTGTASTNGACFLGLIAAALVAVVMG